MIAIIIALSVVVLLGCCVFPVGSANAGQAGEPLLTVSEVCARVPGVRGNKRISPSTVTRWILTGCPARNGQRVRLRAVRGGARWLVRPADLDAFFAALTATETVPQSPTTQHKSRSEAQRHAASGRAAEELKSRGA